MDTAYFFEVKEVPVMNYKERGYLFQDIFSTYIIIKYVKQILCGQKVQTEVVLDK